MDEAAVKRNGNEAGEDTSTPTSTPYIEFKVAPHGTNPVDHETTPMTRENIFEQILQSQIEETLQPEIKEFWQSEIEESLQPEIEESQSRMRCKELFQSSLGDDATRDFLPKENGFVHTIIHAYNNHHDLVIRPDDVWIAILSQLNLYVNANAEALRSFFVQHEGQKGLIVRYDGVTRYTMDFSIMARDLASLLKENINDPALYDVILPNFSTSTLNDKTICSAMMMSILKAYFTFSCHLTCGIPAVKLMGTKGDYESIMTRLDKINEMGDEAETFVALLRPVIRQFIATFDVVSAGKEPNLDFWSKICHVVSNGSGPYYLSGWLVVFCAWNADGKWQGPRSSAYVRAKDRGEEQDKSTFDASIYGRIDMGHIPIGFAEVPVKLVDNGVGLNCKLLSGHVGARIRDSNALENKVKDTLQPEPHWFFFEVEET